MLTACGRADAIVAKDLQNTNQRVHYQHSRSHVKAVTQWPWWCREPPQWLSTPPTLHHQTGLQSPSPLWRHQASCVFIHGERGHFSRFTKAVRHTVTRVVKNRKAILMTSKKQNTNWHSLHAMAEFLQNIATGWWCGCYCWACFSNGRILEVTKWGLLGLM